MADSPHQLLVFGEERVLVVPGHPASLLDSVPCHCSDAGYASRDHTGATILSSVGCPACAKSRGIVGPHRGGMLLPLPSLATASLLLVQPGCRGGHPGATLCLWGRAKERPSQRRVSSGARSEGRPSLWSSALQLRLDPQLHPRTEMVRFLSHLCGVPLAQTRTSRKCRVDVGTAGSLQGQHSPQ